MVSFVFALCFFPEWSWFHNQEGSVPVFPGVPRFLVQVYADTHLPLCYIHNYDFQYECEYTDRDPLTQTSR